MFDQDEDHETFESAITAVVTPRRGQTEPIDDAQIDDDLPTIEVPKLAAVSGGMQWRELRRSTHIEDRRPAWAIKRDNEWFMQQEAREHPVPLPPRRPSGL